MGCANSYDVDDLQVFLGAFFSKLQSGAH